VTSRSILAIAVPSLTLMPVMTNRLVKVLAVQPAAAAGQEARALAWQ
jgi:hypothetical protein